MAQTRKRTRPAQSVPKVRKRSRPKKQPTQAVDPRLPKSWPNGSAVTIGQGNKKYKEHQRRIGEPDENNPNLIGRIVCDRTNIDPVYTAWRWYEGRYHHLTETGTHREAMDALSKAHGGW